MRDEPILLGGGRTETGAWVTVRNPYDDQPVARVHQAGEGHLREAVASAREGQEAMARLPTYRRAEILRAVADRIREERESLAGLIVQEVGKPVRFALGEVDRAVETFSLAAEEVRRWGGGTLPVDIQPRTEGYSGLYTRVPRGPILGISPFNFPLNLAAHKVAPALAVGSAVVLKPPPQGPTPALRMGAFVREAGAPEGAVQVVPTPVERAQALVEDDAFRMLSFTGSDRVGWELKARAGRKRVALELGGNAAMIVHGDADLDWAAARGALGAFAYAGQVCISVQRLLVQDEVADVFLDRFLEATDALGVGDPGDPATVVGPVIDGDAASRIEDWVGRAVAAGARVHRGIRRTGNVLHPVVLEGVEPDQPVVAEEVFGPVVVVERYGAFHEALASANRSRYGLQAGVFTRDLHRVRQAFGTLEVGGVVVNDSPMLRVDNQPYGGVKDSGLGREGVRWAMEEMSDPKMLILGGEE